MTRSLHAELATGTPRGGGSPLCAAALLAMAACGSPSLPPPTEPATETPETTGTPPVPTPPSDVQASCAVSPLDALLVRCDVRLPAPRAVTLTLAADGVPTRVFSSDEATAHHLLAWGLVPQTTYTWAVEDRSGALTTGPLPDELAIDVQVTGDAGELGFDAVVRPVTCPESQWAVMIDREGRVVWYDEVSQRGELVGYGSFEWSDAHRTALTANTDGFVESDIAGEIVLELRPQRDYPPEHVLHHDSERWGSYRYLLFRRRVDQYSVDGVHVFEGDELVGTWFMDEHFPVGGELRDWSHGNGISVDDDGVMVMSFMSLDAVVAVDGDPASPTFLETLWHATGRTGSSPLPDPEFVPAVPDHGFARPHNASVLDGDLWVFDNFSQLDSRALRLAMNHERGTLAITGAWSFAEPCSVQGGAQPIDGGVLATCAPSGRVWAFKDAATEPAWQMTAQCGGASPMANRAIAVRY